MAPESDSTAVAGGGVSAAGGASLAHLETRVRAVFERIAGDLAMVIDRTIEIGAPRVALSEHKVAGRDAIHVSFRIALRRGAEEQHGCLLVPLPTAISLASYLLMLSDDEVGELRGSTTLDRQTKDAMIEIGNFVAGAVDAVQKRADAGSARAHGCQGVRAGLAPAFERAPDVPLVVARAALTLAAFPPCELILMVPETAFAA